MQKFYTIIFFLLVFSPVFSQTPIDVKKTQHQRVTQAYIYLECQELLLNAISNKYPSLNSGVTISKSEFYLNFGKSKENMVTYLQSHYGDTYPKFEEYIRKEILKIVAENDISSMNAAENFIVEVHNRSKGAVISPVLETLLNFQFKDNPEQEFLAGFTNLFNTKGHPKSKKTNWQISVPKSWSKKEGIRPNIIQIFNSENTDGLEIISLIVKDMEFPSGYTPSQKEVLNLFSENGLKNMVPSGSKFISGKRAVFDGYAGGILEIEQILQRVDIKMKIRILQYFFYNNGKMYMMQCSVGGSDSEDLDNRMKKLMPLFRLIANSITVNERYK